MTTTSTTRRAWRLSLRNGAIGLLLALTGQPLLAQQTPRPSPARAVLTTTPPDLDTARAQRTRQRQEQEARMAQQRQALEARLAAQVAAQGPVSTTAPSATFSVTNTNDAGAGSLRQAITDANGTTAADVIDFDIPGAGTHTIQPLSALPIITQPVHIDGTTEPDFAGTPVIELDGQSAGAGVNGLEITGSGSTVQGLVINRFGDNGVLIAGAGATDNTVAGNYIGTNSAGTAALGNGFHGVMCSSKWTESYVANRRCAP